MTSPPPWTRKPLWRTHPAAGEVSIPMSSRALTPRGVSPSPQTFSRGNVAFSRTTTSRPAWASHQAAHEPAGPAPTTTTSARCDAPSGGAVGVPGTWSLLVRPAGPCELVHKGGRPESRPDCEQGDRSPRRALVTPFAGHRAGLHGPP